MGNAVVTEGLELSFERPGPLPFDAREGHVLASVCGSLVVMGGSSEDPRIHCLSSEGGWSVAGGRLFFLFLLFSFFFWRQRFA